MSGGISEGSSDVSREIQGDRKCWPSITGRSVYGGIVRRK
jgi:hypothetical protein